MTFRTCLLLPIVFVCAGCSRAEPERSPPDSGTDTPSVSGGTASSAPDIDIWMAADLNVERLPAAAFPELPPAVAAVLNERKCTIPQAGDAPKPNNVIKGAFRQRGQEDWAVLCSVNRSSSTLIFWGGSADDVEELGGAEDRHALQGMGESGIIFAWLLATASRDYILAQYEAYGGPPPPVIRHDGIEFAFVGSADESFLARGSIPRRRWLVSRALFAGRACRNSGFCLRRSSAMSGSTPAACPCSVSGSGRALRRPCSTR